MTVKCDPCDGGSIDCAFCEHKPLPRLEALSTQPVGPAPRRIAQHPKPLNPLDTQVGGSHYKGFKIQPIEFAAANGLNFLEGNVVKYTVRRKDDKAKRLEDLRKAIDNLTKLIYFIESDICS